MGFDWYPDTCRNKVIKCIGQKYHNFCEGSDKSWHPLGLYKHLSIQAEIPSCTSVPVMTLGLSIFVMLTGCSVGNICYNGN